MKIPEYLKTLYRRVRNKKVSYAQTGEDLMADFFLSGVSKGFFVDVGTNDPIFLNNTYFFYKKGWSGLCVEPNEFRCKLIRSARPRDIVLNVGVGEKTQVLDFHTFDPDTISTFSAYEAEEFKKLGHKFLGTKPVSVVSLSELFTSHVLNKEIDLLSVDTEGLDLEVLKSNHWQKFRPKIIIVEVAEYRGTTLLRNEPEFSKFLLTQNYIKLADTYINGIYIEKSFAERKGLNF